MSNTFIIGVGQRTMMLGDMGAKPTMPVQRYLFNAFADIEPWGQDNLEPQHLLTDAKSNTVLNSALLWVAKALYGAGLEYGYTDENGFQRQSIPAIDAILKQSRANEQLYKGFVGYKMLGNAWPELILSKDRKKVNKVAYLDSSYCRLEKFDAQFGGHKHLYVDANWKLNFGRVDPATTVMVPAMPEDAKGMEAQYMKEGKLFKYAILGISQPTLGNSYYGEPDWGTVRKTGWLAYANQIPKFKEAYLKNASHIKYAIHVPLSWWLWKYPNWDTFTAEEKQEKRKYEHDRFDEFLAGYENAGKSLMLTYRDDPGFQQKGYTQWKIETVDAKVIEGILSDDVLETTQMLHNAAGVDSTLLGSSPGAKMGGGSGSDKREAFNIFMAITNIDQDMVLKPFEIMAEYNGYSGLKFKMGNRFLQLLSDVTPSQRNAE